MRLLKQAVTVLGSVVVIAVLVVLVTPKTAHALATALRVTSSASSPVPATIGPNQPPLTIGPNQPPLTIGPNQPPAR